jgi:ABC-type nitrate/sulfonate/bicarbonate transport system permease component
VTVKQVDGPAAVSAPSVKPAPRGTSSWLRRLARFLPALIFSLIVLTIWQLAVAATGISELLLPAPTKIAGALWQDHDLFVSNGLVTLKEILLGFALGAAVGLALGIALFYSRLLERAIYPWLVASQMVPVAAIAPILVLWFGFTILPKVLVVALICFFPLVVNTVDGLRSVDPDMVNLLRTMGASKPRIIWTVNIPAALPFVFSGLRIGIALSVVGAVFGEWVGSSEGLGYLMLAFNNQLSTVKLFAAVFVLSVVGIALFFAVGILELMVIPWYHRGRRQASKRE